MSKQLPQKDFQGLIPPQAVDVEESIIGALLLESSSFDEISDLITEDSFYNSVNRILFSTISRLHKRGDAVDILTVTTQLKKDNLLEEIGGPAEITKKIMRVASSANIEYWSLIVQEMYFRRELIRVCNEATKKAFDLSEDFTSAFNQLQGDLILTIEKGENSLRHISEVTMDVIENMKRNAVSDSTLSGIPTGFVDLDRATGGFQRGDLVVLSGETSNGKTALALNIAKNSALLGHRVGIWSYEMTDVQLAARQIATVTNISSKQLLFGKMSEEDMTRVMHDVTSLVNSEIYIEKTRNASYEKLESSIRSAVVKNKVEMAVIDYLQLIKLVLKGQTKADAIAEIANSLKQLAITLNIPIVLLSQLSRNADSPKPNLSRLKGSGDIENAADVVLFVWRPEKYRREQFECNDRNYNSEGLAHVFIAKGRNIGLSEWVMNFNPELTLFSDFSENDRFVDEYIAQMQPNNDFDFPG